MPDPAVNPPEDKTYEWVTTEGCARCQGMAGYHYTFEPSRPHYKCQCHIQRIYVPGAPSRPRISRGASSSEHEPGQYPDGSFWIHFSALIECPDGSDYSVEITTEVTYREYDATFDDPNGPEEWFDRHWGHAMEDLQEIADQLCGRPLVS